jgi:hypothetical protein
MALPIGRNLRIEDFRVVSFEQEPIRVAVIIRMWSIDHPGKIAEKLSSLPWLDGPDTLEWENGSFRSYPSRQAIFFLARDPTLFSIDLKVLGPKGAFKVNILNAETREIFYKEFEEAA